MEEFISILLQRLLLLSSLLAPGLYTIQVMDGNGCLSTLTPEIVVAAQAITVAACGIAPTCPQGADGMIVVTATGGTGALEYSIIAPPSAATPPQPSNIITNLPAGRYQVLVTDINGCTGYSPLVTVPSASPYFIENVVITPISCFNAHDATITVNVFGGQQPLNYVLDVGTPQQMGPQQSNVFTNVGPGVHTVGVISASTPACLLVYFTPNIVNPSAVTFTTSTVPPLCAGAANGKIFIFASGGTPPYMYSIDGGFNYGPGSEFDGLTSGSYNVFVKDSHGCTTSAKVIVPSVTAVNIVNVAITNASCAGGNNGKIVITATGGTGIYTYSIDGGITNTTSNVFTGLTAGEYPIVVTDSNGCQAKGLAIVTQPSPLTAIALQTNSSSCPCPPSGSAIVIASGGTPPYQFQINGGAFGPLNTFNNLRPGLYSFTVMDANGCLAYATVQIDS